MMRSTLKTAIFSALLLATAAAAQEPPPVEVDIVGGGVKSAIAIAVPAMPGQMGRDIAQVIASDLRSTGKFSPIGPGGIPSYAQEQAAAPVFAEWRSAGASALVTGYVDARPDGRLTLACYLHDVTAGRALGNQGFTVTSNNWRQAAHKCADLVYSRLSGQGAFLDTRVVYVAESGPRTNRLKRIAIMDSTAPTTAI